jgi:hypothetical protein
VDVPAKRVRADQPETPEDQQDHCDCPKHRLPFCSYARGLQQLSDHACERRSFKHLQSETVSTALLRLRQYEVPYPSIRRRSPHCASTIWTTRSCWSSTPRVA